MSYVSRQEDNAVHSTDNWLWSVISVWRTKLI